MTHYSPVPPLSGQHDGNVDARYGGNGGHQDRAAINTELFGKSDRYGAAASGERAVKSKLSYMGGPILMMFCVGACSILNSSNAENKSVTADDPANEITGYTIETDGADPEPIYAHLAARTAYVRKLHGQCLIDMARRDPVADAKAALARHDYRLWGGQNSEDWGYRAPGLKCMFEKLDVQQESKNYFTREGDGGGDLGIRCSEQILQYQIIYNRYIAAHLPNFKQRLGCRSESDPPKTTTAPQ